MEDHKGALELIPRVMLGNCESACLVNVHAPSRPQSATPLHIIWVIDRSGSMQGVPMNMANQTTRALCEELEERRKNMDFVSVIGFNGEAQIFKQNARPSDVQVCMEAEGGTNFLAACEAITHVKGQENALVILLTDGKCPRVSAQALSQALPSGCPVAIIGLGDDIDVFKLSSAATGIGPNGSYLSAHTPDDIPKVVGLVIGQCLSIAWQSVEVEAKCEKSTIWDPTGRATSLAPDHLLWQLGSMEAGVSDALVLNASSQTHLVVSLSAVVEEKSYQITKETPMASPGPGNCLHPSEQRCILTPKDIRIMLQLATSPSLTPVELQRIKTLPLSQADQQRLRERLEDPSGILPPPSILARQVSDSIQSRVRTQ